MDACSLSSYNYLVSNIIIPSTSTDSSGLSRYKGKSWNAKNVIAADHLIKFKKKAHEYSGKAKAEDPLWSVVEEVIKTWHELRPSEYKSSIIDLDATRSELHDKEFGSVSKEKTKGSGNLRRTLDVPVFVEMVLRRLYTTDELPFDKEWYGALWRKFPVFRVSEKI